MSYRTKQKQMIKRLLKRFAGDAYKAHEQYIKANRGDWKEIIKMGIVPLTLADFENSS